MGKTNFARRKGLAFLLSLSHEDTEVRRLEEAAVGVLVLEVDLTGVTDFSHAVGVQSQTFTIVNDEAYYYPDLMRGMIVDANHGKTVTAYSGSTTGTSRSNTVCSAYGPITWHVDRTCHLISASTFDKMCADMKGQNDDMTDDLYAHGSREVVAQSLTADNKQDISAAYIWGA